MTKIVKVKTGKRKLHAMLKDSIAQKGMRAYALIGRLNANNRAAAWNPNELDAIALELRHLAFQVRALKNAKLALEEC